MKIGQTVNLSDPMVPEITAGPVVHKGNKILVWDFLYYACRNPYRSIKRGLNYVELHPLENFENPTIREGNR